MNVIETAQKPSMYLVSDPGFQALHPVVQVSIVVCATAGIIALFWLVIKLIRMD